MCIIAVKPAGVSWLSHRQMRNCFINNPDGAGLAWVDEDGIHVSKGYFKWQQLYRDMKVLADYPAMVHFRLATHGSISTNNCHPFILSNGGIFAHNGIIPIKPLEKDMTDSETFGKQFLEKFTLEELEKPHIKELLESYIGRNNKISILKPDGNFIILNKHCGIEYQDIWFSNDSFDYFIDYFTMSDHRSKKKKKYKDNGNLWDDYFNEQYGFLNDPFYVSDTLTF
jgi:glutamine amidotransferase